MLARSMGYPVWLSALVAEGGLYTTWKAPAVVGKSVDYIRATIKKEHLKGSH